MRCRGYDHCFLLDGLQDEPAVTLVSGDKAPLPGDVHGSARRAALHRQLAGRHPARGGGEWQNYQGSALEAQQLPDSPEPPSSSAIPGCCPVRPIGIRPDIA